MRSYYSFGVAVLVGCSSPAEVPDGGHDAEPIVDAGLPGACPLDPVARALVEEIVVEGLLDAVFIGLESDVAPSAHIAVAITLPGTTTGSLASYSPMGECVPDTYLATTCNDPALPESDPFYETRVVCGRRGWDADCTELEQVWYSMLPQRELEPRHEFTYPLAVFEDSPIAGLEGEVRWAENPLVTYVRTLREDGALVVRADVQRSFSLVLADRTLDLSHEGYVEAVVLDGHPQSATFGAVFSALAGSRVISATGEITNDEGRAEGTVVVDGLEVIGAVEGTLPDTPRIIWSPACASPEP